MACIKCGRKVKDQHVFCEDCLAEAEGYPVDPATPIQLPAHAPVVSQKKKGGKKKAARPPEAQLKRLRASMRWLLFALVVVLLAFCLTALMLLNLLEQRDQPSADRWTPDSAVQTRL